MLLWDWLMKWAPGSHLYPVFPAAQATVAPQTGGDAEVSNAQMHLSACQKQ